MIMHAFERNHRDKDHRVEYQICDAMLYKHELNSFDYVFRCLSCVSFENLMPLIYSRDCIQHIKDTETLFQNAYVSLNGNTDVICF